jgi:hypothetical protein
MDTNDLCVEWLEEICVKVTGRGFDPRGLTCDGACAATRWDLPRFKFFCYF